MDAVTALATDRCVLTEMWGAQLSNLQHSINVHGAIKEVAVRAGGVAFAVFAFLDALHHTAVTTVLVLPTVTKMLLQNLPVQQLQDFSQQIPKGCEIAQVITHARKAGGCFAEVVAAPLASIVKFEWHATLHQHLTGDAIGQVSALQINNVTQFFARYRVVLTAIGIGAAVGVTWAYFPFSTKEVQEKMAQLYKTVQSHMATISQPKGPTSMPKPRVPTSRPTTNSYAPPTPSGDPFSSFPVKQSPNDILTPEGTFPTEILAVLGGIGLFGAGALGKKYLSRTTNPENQQQDKTKKGNASGIQGGNSKAYPTSVIPKSKRGQTLNSAQKKKLDALANDSQLTIWDVRILEGIVKDPALLQQAHTYLQEQPPSVAENAITKLAQYNNPSDRISSKRRDVPPIDLDGTSKKSPAKKRHPPPHKRELTDEERAILELEALDEENKKGDHNAFSQPHPYQRQGSSPRVQVFAEKDTVDKTQVPPPILIPPPKRKKNPQSLAEAVKKPGLAHIDLEEEKQKREEAAYKEKKKGNTATLEDQLRYPGSTLSTRLGAIALANALSDDEKEEVNDGSRAEWSDDDENGSDNEA